MGFGYFIHLIVRWVGFWASAVRQGQLGAGGTAQIKATSFPFDASEPGMCVSFPNQGLGGTAPNPQRQHLGPCPPGGPSPRVGTSALVLPRWRLWCQRSWAGGCIVALLPFLFWPLPGYTSPCLLSFPSRRQLCVVRGLWVGRGHPSVCSSLSLSRCLNLGRLLGSPSHVPTRLTDGQLLRTTLVLSDSEAHWQAQPFPGMDKPCWFWGTALWRLEVGN